MATYGSGAMIALVPTVTDWCDIEFPHMTLVFAGQTEELKPGDFNSLAKDASSLALMSSPLSLKVTGTAVFGDEEPVNVLLLQATPELMAMRHMVERWHASEHPFNPHATIGPVMNGIRELPLYLHFDKLAVGWDSDYLTFWLRR